MLKMDPFQDSAVNSIGSNIMVSASAGAGKTRVLVERLVKRVVIDRISVNEILAVTFTAAAAAEMKNRVAARLQEELHDTTDESLKEYLLDQIIKLETTDITTIDSFCLTIIGKYSNVIGLDPACAQNILSEGQGRTLAYQAYRSVLSEYRQKDMDRLTDLFIRISPRSEDFDTLYGLLREIATHAGNSDNPDAWYMRMKQLSEPVDHFSAYPKAIQDAFFKKLQLDYDRLYSYLLDMQNKITESEKLKPEQLQPAFNLLANCQEAIDRQDYDSFLSHLENFASQAKTPADSKTKSYSDVRKKMIDTLNKIAEELYQTNVFLSDTRQVYDDICLLLDMARDVENEFVRLKRENAAMDFTDMEHYALSILTANDNTVANHYRNKYKEVMVDEFQDTSILQDAILTLLAKPGTIFRVGDVKQSIYRFRQAKPDLMRSIMQDAQTKQITLAYNYRSKDNIVEFCNALFQRIMNIPNAKDHYDEKDSVSVGTDRQKLSEPDPVQFILVEEPTPQESVRKPSAKARKAEWIASEIQRLIQKGYEYGDMCILVRSHHDKTPLRIAFDNVNIPYNIDGREGFYQSELCQTILGFLNYMQNPADEISLLTVVTSLYFQISSETLAQLKIQHGSVRLGIEVEYPEIIEELHALQKIGTDQGALAFLDAIAIRHGFYESLDNDGKANFDFLYEKTLQLSNNFCSLHDLQTEMLVAQDEKSSEAMSRGQDEQLVTVTTIHQSKGLQYKVVFLWSTSLNKQSDSSAILLMDDELGIGMHAIDLPYRTKRPTLQRLAISYQDNAEDLEEYTRLLYVALTRAEQKLYLVDVEENAVEYQDNMNMAILNRRKGMTGLVLAALQPIPGLFSIRHVAPALPVSQDALPPKYVQSLKRWTGPIPQQTVSLRPSQHEVSTLPGLDTGKRHYGKRHGTFMHDVLSKLPNTMWIAEMLAPYKLTANEENHILAFASSDFYQKALTMDIHKEMSFYTEQDHVRTMGIMDFVAVSDQEILLLDFKTDAVSDPTTLATRYQEQLSAYAKALHIIYPGRKVIASLWSLSADAEVKIPEIS